MTARDFSSRPVQRSGLLDRALVGLGVLGLVTAAATALATRRDLAQATVEAPPARILAELASLMPGDVRLSGATLTYSKGVEVELSVVAREEAAYDRFLERLATSPRFTDILPGAESRGGAISAPIRMRYPTGEAP